MLGAMEAVVVIGVIFVLAMLLIALSSARSSW